MVNRAVRSAPSPVSRNQHESPVKKPRITTADRSDPGPAKESTIGQLGSHSPLTDCDRESVRQTLKAHAPTMTQKRYRIEDSLGLPGVLPTAPSSDVSNER